MKQPINISLFKKASNSLCVCAPRRYIFKKATLFVYVLRGAIYSSKKATLFMYVLRGDIYSRKQLSLCRTPRSYIFKKQLSLCMCSEELHIYIFKKARNPLHVCAPRSYLSRTDADGRSKMLMSRL